MIVKGDLAVSPENIGMLTVTLSYTSWNSSWWYPYAFDAMILTNIIKNYYVHRPCLLIWIYLNLIRAHFEAVSQCRHAYHVWFMILWMAWCLKTTRESGTERYHFAPRIRVMQITTISWYFGAGAQRWENKFKMTTLDIFNCTATHAQDRKKVHQLARWYDNIVLQPHITFYRLDFLWFNRIEMRILLKLSKVVQMYVDDQMQGTQ